MNIVPYSPEEDASARAFNDRMRAKNQTEFLLPERYVSPGPETAAIRDFHYLALEGGMVRGGYLLAHYPAAFANGENTPVLNAREPLSEGLIDPKYSLLALRLLKNMQQQGKYLFALGMGSEQANFTRLLRGAGWSIRPVPFFFHVLRAGRFLSELQLLKGSALKRIAAQVGALSGSGKVALSVLQRSAFGARTNARGLTLENVHEWGEWADKLWAQYLPLCSFGVRRDRPTLTELYRFDKDRSQVFLVRQQGEPVGWIATQNSKMSGHKFFGNMQVATILDGITAPEWMRGAVALVTRALHREGADLVVANHSHTVWADALRTAGFLSRRSNYILATNKALSEQITKQPAGFAHVHFTRGDGDGRGHL